MDSRPARCVPALLALFAALTLAVSARADTFYIEVQWGGSGSVSPSGILAIERGGAQAFSFTASGCHAVQDVQVDEVSIGIVSSYTFTDVQSDHLLYVTFGPPPASVSLSAAPAVGLCSRPDTLTASVPGASQVPVRFYEGEIELGSAVLNNAGSCKFVVSPPLGAGTHALVAKFDGSACLQASQSAPLDYVVQDASNAAPELITSLQIFDGVFVGADLNVIARLLVSGQPLPWMYGGAVEFYEDGVPIRNVGVAQGVAYMVFQPQTRGTHVYSAHFLGNDCLPPMTSQGIPVVVRQRCGATVAGDPNPSLPGQPVTVTATVCSPAASGTVTFLANPSFGTQVNLGTVPLVNGTAQITHAFAGLNDVYIEYSGDSLFVGDASGGYRQTAVYPVAANLESDPVYPSSWRQMTLTAHIEPSNAIGDCAFRAGGILLGYGTPDNGDFRLVFGPFESYHIGPGPHTIVADFDGLGPWGDVSDTLGVEVDGPNTGVITTLDGAITDFSLSAAWPNPSAGATHMRFTLPAAAPVRLSVLDTQGREVALLADRVFAAGRYEARWDAGAPPGLYFVRCATPGRTLVRHVVIAR